MFDKVKFSAFYHDHKAIFIGLAALRAELRTKFYAAENAIDCISLAALTGYPALLIGPPGVAKSRLIRAFCELLGVAHGLEAKDRKYFEYLLTSFTEPTELFGSFQMEVDASGRTIFNRDSTGMLHNCEVAFLDEVFNGSSAILNALLALMNERVFHDRGRIQESQLKLVIGATNLTPKSDQLRAIFDRFVLRAHLQNVDPAAKSYAQFLTSAMSVQSSLPANYAGLLEKIVKMREDFAKARDKIFVFKSEGEPFLRNLAAIVEYSQSGGLGSFSNRRLVQLVNTMAMQRMMRAGDEKGVMLATDITPEDYRIIFHHFMDNDYPLSSSEMERLESFPGQPLYDAKT